MRKNGNDSGNGSIQPPRLIFGAENDNGKQKSGESSHEEHFNLALSPATQPLPNASITLSNLPPTISPAVVQPTPTNVDPDYPGTAVSRMLAVRDRIKRLARHSTPMAENIQRNSQTTLEISGLWEDIRSNLLKAGGLRELTSGPGDTSFMFRDFHHVDLTAVVEEVWYNERTNIGSENSAVIVQSTGVSSPGTKTNTNSCGDAILLASLWNDDELGSIGTGGGSWVTSSAGCHTFPVIRDTAHIQFRSRIAFKLVWIPTRNFDTFVLVDDDGVLLARGVPTFFTHFVLGDASRPTLKDRVMNYNMVAGSKYATAADNVAASIIQQDPTQKPSIETFLLQYD